MSAYATFYPFQCQVKTSATPAQGGSIGPIPGATPGMNYSISSWNQMFPAWKWTVPTWCPAAPSTVTPPAPPPPTPAPTPSGPGAVAPPQSAAQQVPASPITGDPPHQSPPPEACGPAMLLPEASSSYMFRDGKRRGGNTADQITLPITAGLFAFATYAGGEPVYTQKPRLDLTPDARGGQVFHEGTGPGGLCLGPAELLDYHQYGSSALTLGRWPTTISPATLLLLNSTRIDSSAGDDARTYLAFGRLLEGTDKPGYGMYFSFNPSTRVLDLRVTDADGDDENAGGLSLNGSPVGMPNLIQVTPQDLLMSGDVDDFMVTSSLLLCNPSTTTRRLTGMVEAEGALVKIENVSTDGSDLELAHLSDSSMANQFFCPTGADVTLEPGQGCWAAYDDVNNYWVLNGVPGGGSGTGDVVGPASAADNAVARFDSTTGKLIQNSGLIVDDASGGTIRAHTGAAASLLITPDSSLSSGTFDTTIDAGGTGSTTMNVGTVAANAVNIGRSGRIATTNGQDYTAGQRRVSINTPSQITGNQTGYTGFNTGVHQRASTDASRTINTILAPTGAAGGYIIVTNIGSFDLVFLNDAGATGTAADRIITGLGMNYTLGPGQTAELQYDTASSRWRIL